MLKSLIRHNRPNLNSGDIKAISEPLTKGMLASGSLNREFERAVSKFLNKKYACAVSSGTAALHLALLALEIKKGDEVILPTYVCTALLNAVNYTGATPVLVDADPTNLGPSVEDVRKKITKKTRAIIVNHTFGFPASIQKIKSFGIPVIEDCAQSLGSSASGRKLGSFGDLTTLSFYATKMMTAGYGGMVLTDQKKYADRILDLVHFDQRKDYKIRYNYYLSDVMAALGLSQLKRLPFFIAKRKANAAIYLTALQKTSFFFWKGSSGEQPNYYRFLIGSLKPQKTLIRAFAKQGVEVISPLAPYQLLHRYLGKSPKHFPVAEALARSVVSIPVHPGLRPGEIRKISKALIAVSRKSLA